MLKLKLNEKKQKIYLLLIVIFLLLSVASFATFARHKNRNPLNIDSTWDGSYASSYRSGTGLKDDPYVISNASELAYFSNMLKTTSYNNTYFILNNDIIINNGIFKYEDNFIKYILDGNTYFIDEYSSNYYDSSNMTNKIGNVNIFNSLDNFKGNLDGNSHTIYGAYITDSDAEYLGLFTNLNGNIKDLYVQNSLVYGGIVTGGISSNSNNTSILNTVYEGYVISNNNDTYKTTQNTLDDIILSKDNNQVNVSLNSINDLNYDIESIVLEGKVTSLSDNFSLSINENSIDTSDFSINLDSNISNLYFKYSSSDDESISITNLKYKIKYKLGIASGITAVASNTTISNTINKSYVYGYNYSSGIVGFANENISINRSYNNGQINSNNISSGIVSCLKNAISTISTSYNSGQLSGNLSTGIIGNVVNTNNLSIQNVFNTIKDSYFAGNINNSSVNIINSYNVTEKYINSGNYTGKISLVLDSNLKDKCFLTSGLSFEEFTDLDNLSNNENYTWIYEDNSYPILFIDDIKNPLATININSYSWNNVSYSLEEILIDNNITFNISKVDNLNKIKEIYYYISNEKKALSYDELNNISNWNLYEGAIKIEEEGFYVIYAKVIDYNENVTYINSDLLVLDLSGADINISYDDKNLNSLNYNPSNYFINSPLNVCINATDKISGIKLIQYYISSDILDKDSLYSLSEDLWQNYINNITINNNKSIIYIRVIDNSGIVTYANSDLILYEGYVQTGLYLSRDEANSFDELNITSTSTITLKYEYESSYNFNNKDTNYLVSNEVLPSNTKITLNLNNDIYTYIVENNDFILKDSLYLYNFNLFSLVGKSTKETFKRNINDKIEDIYKVTLDFSNTNIDNDINGLKLSIKVLDDNMQIVRDTIEGSIKEINLYTNLTSNITVSSDYKDEIMYNSSSTNDIDISLVKEYNKINNLNIIDTILSDMVWGVKIKVLDSSGNIVDHKYLKNIKYEIDGKNYSMNNDTINVNLSSSDYNLNKRIKIITSCDNSTLENGKYYFDITGYLSYDGVIENKLSDNSIKILLNVSNSRNTNNYSFDILDNNSKIIKKNSDNYDMNYNVLYKGKLSNPKIYVSLFKKSILSAYDVNYSLLDIENYISNDLVEYQDNLYLLMDNPKTYNGSLNNNVTISLNSNKFDYNLYKLRFYLYDNDKMVGFTDKTFIVK